MTTIYLSESDDTGTYGADYSSAYVYGNGGNDKLTGTFFTVSLFGGAGDDVLKATNLQVTMAGGTGNDIYHLEGWSQLRDGLLSPNITESAGEGFDKLYLNPSSLWNFVLPDSVSIEQIDVLGGISMVTGNNRDNIINLTAGWRANGGAGNDTLNAFGTNYSYLNGDEGNDTINGSNAYEALNGGSGNDTLTGGDGNDTLDGGQDDDRFTYYSLDRDGGGADTAGDGDDTIKDTSTTSRNDVLVLTDLLPSDVYLARSGSNITVHLVASDERIATLFERTLNFGSNYSGVDRIEFKDGAIWNRDFISNFQPSPIINGSEGDDMLAGWSDQQVINGQGGNDHLSGGASGISLFGGAGDDSLKATSGGVTMAGGTGDDSYVVDLEYRDHFFDLTINETDGQGFDTLYLTDSGSSNTSFLLADGASIEVINWTGGFYRFTGNASNNIINVSTSYGGTAYGGAGDDTLNGYGQRGEEFHGGDGNDIVKGGSGDSKLFGDLGNDLLIGGDGKDKLDGGEGQDQLLGGSGKDELVGGEGQDQLTGGDGDDTLQGGEGDDHFVYYHLDSDADGSDQAGDGDDTIFDSSMTSENDVLLLADLLPSDVYLIKSGNDVAVHLVASDARIAKLADRGLNMGTKFTSVDSIEFMDGTVWDRNFITNLYPQTIIEGTEGGDTLTGSADNQTTLGFGGDDELSAQVAGVRLVGGAGDDNYYFSVAAPGSDGTLNIEELHGEGFDTVYLEGSLWDSIIRPSLRLGDDDSIEKIVVRSGNYNNIVGNELANEIVIGTADRFIESPEISHIEAGGGDDRIRFEGFASLDSIHGGAGNDVIDLGQFGNGPYFREIHGDDGDDVIYAGNDYHGTVYGGDGNDIIHGSTIQLLSGGAGDDVYYLGEAPLGNIHEEENGGYDTLYLTGGTIGIGENVEKIVMLSNDYGVYTNDDATLILASSDGGNIYAAGGNDTVEGGAGADQIDGGDGNDTITGGGGNDTLYGDYSPDIGFDHQSGDDILIGDAGDDTIYGDAGNDSLDGGAGNDSLDGGTGNDVLNGGAGDDVYIVDSILDTVTELTDEGIDTIQSYAAATALAANVERLVLVDGSDAVSATGNALANTISGNAASNKLSGGAGDDTLYGDADNDVLHGGSGRDLALGGTGNDVIYGTFDDNLTGGAGRDQFRFSAAFLTDASRDVIADFKQGEDRIDIRLIDAKESSTADDAFTFIGRKMFTGAAGEIRVSPLDRAGTVNDITIISADTDGDRVADFRIELTGLKLLVAEDFIL